MAQTKSAALREQSGTTIKEYSQRQDAPFSHEKQPCCWLCGYLRAVRLTRHLRTFCALSGMKVRPESPVCEFFTTEAVL